MTEADYTGARALVDAILTNRGTLGFGVPGESYLAVLDAFVDVADRFRFITCRHEAGAANMAEAYGKLTGEPGLAFVTRGPGACHAAIGLHTAFQDSTPMILFVGQVARDQVEREAFQEIDYRRFFSEVSKWSAEIPDASRVAEFVGRAFRTATSGRPGPVVLALPEDMLTEVAPRIESRPYSPARAYPAPSDMAALKSKLLQAERPLVLIGGSGWTASACSSLEQLAEQMALPVAASFRAQDRFNNDHPSYIGDVGIGANPALIRRLQNSDLLIALGPRLGEMTTGGYERLVPPTPGVPLIHIHQGAEELGRVYQPELAIQASPQTFIEALGALDMDPSPVWVRWRDDGRADYEAWQQPTVNPGAVQLADLYVHMREHLPADTIFTNGAGNYTSWLHRFHRYRRFPSQLAPTSGAMGYGVPAAIAAKLTMPERTVICCAGDGCFTMSAVEMATAVQYGAAVIFIVFNNRMYGTIRMHQERAYPGRVSATDLHNPDFCATARAFGLQAWRVETTADFPGALEQACTSGGPALLEIMVEPDAITPTGRLSTINASP